ncbi:hypothetical protein [Mesorhizobium sp. LSJC255A00]|uniref:DUF7940 domain-containing protein n=1 Tax=Mesorhizobium sp. LSJC255A00 TaxID=1287313 RepID=UPI0018DBB83F|nr:hypothetical protein [Mesorhizobium sp. LSJC255A00]
MNRLNLIDGWHRILFKAWSARLLYLGFAFQVLEQLLPYVDEDSFGISPKAFRLVTVVILVGAVWARVMPQPEIHLENVNADRKDQDHQPRKGRNRRSLGRRIRQWLGKYVWR